MYDKKIKSTMHSTHQEPFDQDFEIQEFLAQGTFAKVFKCVERKTGCTFAVKAFHAEDNHFDKEQINSEIDVWRALQHRNIVSFHKPFYERNSIWVVLEFVKGKTLFDEIVNGKEFTEEGSRIIMQQVGIKVEVSGKKRVFLWTDPKYEMFLVRALSLLYSPKKQM